MMLVGNILLLVKVTSFLPIIRVKNADNSTVLSIPNTILSQSYIFINILYLKIESVIFMFIFIKNNHSLL